MVTSKAPKDKHYSMSSSLKNRISAAVCQKNLGENYLHRVNTLNGLSPGKIRARAAKTLDKVNAKRRIFNSSKEFKARRLQLKSEAITVREHKEIREGKTYETSICLTKPSEQETLEIPPKQEAPAIEQIDKDTNQPLVIVVFDLETTSLSKDCEITLIAAEALDDTALSFSSYVIPKGQIDTNASRVTGITKSFGQLFCKGRPVDANPISLVLSKFAAWLSEMNSHIILVGHNSKLFDAPRLTKIIENEGMIDNFRYISGFSDTLLLFRICFPETKGQYSLGKLFLGKIYDAHYALGDVNSLNEIMAHCKIYADELLNY